MQVEADGDVVGAGFVPLRDQAILAVQRLAVCIEPPAPLMDEAEGGAIAVMAGRQGDAALRSVALDPHGLGSAQDHGAEPPLRATGPPSARPRRRSWP